MLKSRINSEKIDTYKKIYLTEKLNLDQKNESKFWEVYDIYQENLRIIIEKGD